MIKSRFSKFNSSLFEAIEKTMPNTLESNKKIIPKEVYIESQIKSNKNILNPNIKNINKNIKSNNDIKKNSIIGNPQKILNEIRERIWNPLEKDKNIYYNNKYSKIKPKQFKGLGANDNYSLDTQNYKPPELLEKLDTINDEIISQKLEEYEKVIVNDNEKENAIVITKDGEVYKCSGTANRVFIEELGDKLNGSAVTHNHTKEETEHSFSDEDIEMFQSYNLSILKGIDWKYIYELNRNKLEVDPLSNTDLIDACFEIFRHEKCIELVNKINENQKKFGYTRKEHNYGNKQ